MIKLCTAFTLILLASTMNILAQDAETTEDIANGKRIYNRCIACHNVTNDRNKIGPTLRNIIGRTAGTLENYRYSNAMKKAGENGLVWDRETLKQYLHNPHALVRGTKMAAIRLRSDSDIDDLIGYINSASNED